MKNALLFASAAVLVTFASCKKDPKPEPNPAVVSQTQQATVFYFGGTWCPPCGAYGKPGKEYITKAYGDKAQIISCQVNGGTADPMNCASANALAGTFKVSSVPTMFIGGGGTIFSSIVGNGITNSSCATNVDQKLALTPEANMKFTTELTGNDITVKAQTQFFKAITPTSGKYFIAAYLTEDGITATQASDMSTNKNVHDHVLRLTLGTSATGEMLADNAAQWEVKNFTFFGALNNNWNKAKMHVNLVLWKQDPTTSMFTVANSWIGNLQ
jgi:hypothetical protein